jgi:hypothetical protein
MDLRRELAQIRKHYRRYHQVHGESVVWYEFVPFGSDPEKDSVYDDVYDEGRAGTGGRRYRSGLVVPVLMVTETEDQKRAIPEGRQPVQVTNFVCSVEDLRDAGLNEPWEYKRHLNDLFTYDGRYFSITSYRVRGRGKDDVLIVVEGIEIYVGQEFPFDPGPSSLGVTDFPWPSTLADL